MIEQNETNVEQKDDSTPNYNIDSRNPIDLGDKGSVDELYRNFGFALLNSTAETLANELEVSWGKLSNEERTKRFGELSQLITPQDIGSLIAKRAGSDWAQNIQLPGGGKVTVRKGGNPNRATSIISSLTGDSDTIILFLPASGIHVEFEAPKEQSYCDFDFKLSQDLSIVGTDTTGMLLSASSAIPSAHQFQFALDHVTNATISHNSENLTNRLRTRIKSQDIGLFILGPIIASFIGGFPFELTCPVGNCTTTKDIMLALSRIINYDRSMLTEKQLRIVEATTKMGSMSDTQYDEYQAEHSVVTEHRVFIGKVNEVNVYLELQECSAGYYIEQSMDWVRQVEDGNNVIMTEFATEAQRVEHIKQRGSTHKLLRYKHLFKAIVAESQEGEELERIEDRKEILKHLERVSAKPQMSSDIQSGIQKFIVARQISLLGFIAEECEFCGHKAKDGEEFVSISPDLLFFLLSQAVSSVQQMAAEVQKHLR